MRGYGGIFDNQSLDSDGKKLPEAIMIKRCGYCKYFKGYANNRKYGQCILGKSSCGYETFSTNTCCFLNTGMPLTSQYSGANNRPLN